jgi:hypothetical protein
MLGNTLRNMLTNNSRLFREDHYTDRVTSTWIFTEDWTRSPIIMSGALTPLGCVCDILRRQQWTGDRGTRQCRDEDCDLIDIWGWNRKRSNRCFPNDRKGLLPQYTFTYVLISAYESSFKWIDIIRIEPLRRLRTDLVWSWVHHEQHSTTVTRSLEYQPRFWWVSSGAYRAVMIRQSPTSPSLASRVFAHNPRLRRRGRLRTWGFLSRLYFLVLEPTAYDHQDIWPSSI